MKSLIFLIVLFVTLLQGCIFVDDDCYYETRCEYLCDRYGHNCFEDYCWDELICRD